MPYAHIPGTRLHYRERGSGPTALMVHGFPLDSTMWIDQMDRLADVRRCIAVDLRGFGLSDPIGDESLDMQSHARDLVELVDHLGADAVDVIALSMGGYVAMAMARLRPELIRSLALVDTRAEADSEDGRVSRDAMAAAVLADGRRALAATLETVLLPPAAALNVRARIRTMIEACRYETIVAALAGMRDRSDQREALPRIGVPTTVIVGELDVLTPPESSRVMAASVPGAALHVIPGAGHMTPMEAPDAVAAILRAHLDGVTSP